MGLYQANGRYPVNALFGMCGCRRFEMHTGKKKRRKEEVGVPLVVVRCKRLIAAEETEGGPHPCDRDLAPNRGASTKPSLIPGARSKAGGGARGDQTP